MIEVLLDEEIMKRRLFFASLAGLLLGVSGPALAFYNQVQMRVAPSFLPWCGSNWLASMANRLSTGYIVINDKRVLDFDLRNQEHCTRVVTYALDAPGNAVIRVIVHLDDNRGFDMAANLATVAHDRVSRINFDLGSAAGEVLDTDWDSTGRLRPAAAGNPGPGSSDARPSPQQMARTWTVLETDMSSGRYWKATWKFKADGRSFDGHWKVFPGEQEGDLPNFARIRSISKDHIIIDRPGLGTYQGTLSSDRRSIRGTQSWCSTCKWEAQYDQPLPQELR